MNWYICIFYKYEHHSFIFDCICYKDVYVIYKDLSVSKFMCIRLLYVKDIEIHERFVSVI